MMTEPTADPLFFTVQSALAGEYSLIRELGRGGMGVVYLATEVRLAREVTSLVAFIRAGFDEASLSIKLGNAQRGRALFEGSGQCATCHRVNGVGPRLAPDLSDIGAIRTVASLQRSLLQPTESLLPINRPVRIVDKGANPIKELLA